MKWINLVCFICLGSIGCDKPCPEDMTLGDIPLMESSLKSILYQKEQVIEFINETNDTLRYEVFDLRIIDRSIYAVCYISTAPAIILQMYCSFLTMTPRVMGSKLIVT